MEWQNIQPIVAQNARLRQQITQITSREGADWYSYDAVDKPENPVCEHDSQEEALHRPRQEETALDRSYMKASSYFIQRLNGYIIRRERRHLGDSGQPIINLGKVTKKIVQITSRDDECGMVRQALDNIEL